MTGKHDEYGPEGLHAATLTDQRSSDPGRSTRPPDDGRTKPGSWTWHADHCDTVAFAVLIA